MALDTWFSAASFLLLVAPGLFFDLLADRRRVGHVESAFRETSRIALASLAFSAVGLSGVGLARALRPAWMPDPRAMLLGGRSYTAEHYHLLARAAGLEILVALGAAFAANAWLGRGTGSGLRRVSTWRRVFVEECPQGWIPHARIRLSDGTVYVGRVGHYAADLDVADRELILVPPLFASGATGTPLKDLPAEWTRVVIHGPSIAALAVQYRPRPPAEAVPRVRNTRRG